MLAGLQHRLVTPPGLLALIGSCRFRLNLSLLLSQDFSRMDLWFQPLLIFLSFPLSFLLNSFIASTSYLSFQILVSFLLSAERLNGYFEQWTLING